MIYSDIVYGDINITEPVLIELIKTPALQRLKKIKQGGFKFAASANQATRFDHSLGVMSLLKKHQASLEEQVAGLIHDISHSAFSHTIDYALDQGSEKAHTHQDDIFNEFINQTEIPKILKKYNLDLNYILDDKNFPLKEKNLPDLCADRIDYVLRDGVGYAKDQNIEINKFLNNLIVKNKKWLFQDEEVAKDFARYFEMMNRVFYAGLPTAAMFKIVGEGLRYLLQNKLLTLEDLYTDDEVVENKMAQIAQQDPEFNQHWQRMNQQDKFVNDPDNYQHTVWVKSRAVDPLFISNNKLTRVSEVDPKWKKILERESQPKQYFLRLEE